MAKNAAYASRRVSGGIFGLVALSHEEMSGTLVPSASASARWVIFRPAKPPSRRSLSRCARLGAGSSLGFTTIPSVNFSAVW